MTQRLHQIHGGESFAPMPHFMTGWIPASKVRDGLAHLFPILCSTILTFGTCLTSWVTSERLERADIGNYAQMRCQIRSGKAHLTIRNTSNRTIAFIRPSLWNTIPGTLPPGIDEMMPPSEIHPSMIVILEPGGDESTSIDVPRTHTSLVRYTAKPVIYGFSKTTLKQLRKMSVILCDGGDLVAAD